MSTRGSMFAIRRNYTNPMWPLVEFTNAMPLVKISALLAKKDAMVSHTQDTLLATRNTQIFASTTAFIQKIFQLGIWQNSNVLHMTMTINFSNLLSINLF